jgi:N utilization substance protein B
MAVIDKLILRMATWELLHVPGTPAAVVLDEAIELARTFGSDDSVRFVNGLLDAIRKTLEQERDVERS